jgi:hypothetical protein
VNRDSFAVDWCGDSLRHIARAIADALVLRCERITSHDARVKHGIAPLVLASQVAATSGWALEGGAKASATIAAKTVRDATRIETVWQAEPGNLDYLRLLLSAHYLTVGTSARPMSIRESVIMCGSRFKMRIT